MIEILFCLNYLGFPIEYLKYFLSRNIISHAEKLYERDDMICLESGDCLPRRDFVEQVMTRFYRLLEECAIFDKNTSLNIQRRIYWMCEIEEPISLYLDPKSKIEDGNIIYFTYDINEINCEYEFMDMIFMISSMKYHIHGGDYYIYITSRYKDEKKDMDLDEWLEIRKKRVNGEEKILYGYVTIQVYNGFDDPVILSLSAKSFMGEHYETKWLEFPPPPKYIISSREEYGSVVEHKYMNDMTKVRVKIELQKDTIL